MRELLTTLGELVGAFLLAVGCGFIYPPLALIVGGVAMIAFSWLAA